MFSFSQVLLVCIFIFFMSLISWSAQIFAYGVTVLYGFIIGLIMGDVKTGLMVGGTMCLMSLGVGGYGGSSVPDYALGTTVGALFAIVTNGGIEAGLAVGIPVATLGTQFDVLSKMAGSFFIHKQMDASDKGNWNGMTFWVWAWIIMRSVLYTLPVLLVMTVGAELISNLILAIPEWLMTGFSVAAGLLPALGFAMLMKYLPMKRYGVFLIFGFVLSAYASMPMLAIAALTLVVAFLVFGYLEDKNNLVAAAAMTGENDDE